MWILIGGLKTEESLLKLPLTNSFDSDIVIKMDNLIRIYDDILSPQRCQYLIDKFEAHSEMHEKQMTGNYGTGQAKEKSLTRLNLMKSKDTPFREDLKYIGGMFFEIVERYAKDCSLKPFQFPKKFGLEPFTIKRYLPNNDEEFPQHIDVSGGEYLNRFLVMFVYLVNNDEGQTEISLKSEYKGKDYELSKKGSIISSPCKQGSILIFPPYWPWVHTGVAPAKTAKYILGTYCKYV